MSQLMIPLGSVEGSERRQYLSWCFLKDKYFTRQRTRKGHSKEKTTETRTQGCKSGLNRIVLYLVCLGSDCGETEKVGYPQVIHCPV